MVINMLLCSCCAVVGGCQGISLWFLGCSMWLPWHFSVFDFVLLVVVRALLCSFKNILNSFSLLLCGFYSVLGYFQDVTKELL